MPPSETQSDVQRVGADGETVETPTEATDEVLVAKVPGDDESKFVTLTLSNPLNEKDRVYLGLPADAETEVGQKVRVNRNGANAIINAGYATLDPEDVQRVSAVIRAGGVDEADAEATGDESGDPGEPTHQRQAEAPANPLANPPQAQSTPVTPGPNAPQPGQKRGATGGSQPSAEGNAGS